MERKIVVKVIDASDKHVRVKKFSLEGGANFYEKPFPSSVFGIYKSNELLEIEQLDISAFKNAAKCVVVRKLNEYVIFPILHTKKF